MHYSHQGRFQQQVQFLRRKFLQDRGLPFTNVLSEEIISQALAAIEGFIDRIYSSLVTLQAFQRLIAMLGEHDSNFRRHLYEQLLDAIVTHRVADRSDRF